MERAISLHATRRMQQRGVTPIFLDRILDNADVEHAAGDNCRLYRVTRERARSIGDDRLARFAVIWSDDTSRVVTVLPIERSRSGARYRRTH